VKAIQQLKHQRQHFKPLLKVAEKSDTFFAIALFYVQYCMNDLLLQRHNSEQRRKKGKISEHFSDSVSKQKYS
jgi:hypothetical protein